MPLWIKPILFARSLKHLVRKTIVEARLKWKYFRSVMTEAVSNQISQGKLLLSFAVATDEKPIGLGAIKSQYRLTWISERQPSLGSGTNRRDSSDVATINNRQWDSTISHRHKRSKMQIIDIERTVLQHQKWLMMTKLGSVSTRLTRRRRTNMKRNVKREGKRMETTQEYMDET